MHNGNINYLRCFDVNFQTISINESNFSCTGPGIIKKEYVLEDELASAVNDIASAIPDFNGASGINITDDTISLDDPIYVKAGSGISIEEVGNTIRISQDETVLYTASSASDSITTSEEVTHFERLRIELQSAQSTYVKNCLECKPDAGNLAYTCTAIIPAADYPLQMAGVRYTSSNGKNFTFSSATRMCYRVNGTYGDASTTTLANSDIKDVGFITKIFGINRISN